MKRKTSKDIIELIRNFQKFLENKPSFSKMHEEIQMMKFKIRPIYGDISKVNLNNEKFISTLWSLGKLEEFFHKEFYSLSRKNKELFLKIIDSIYMKYHAELNKIDIRAEKTVFDQGFLEMEIFKEVRSKKIN